MILGGWAFLMSEVPLHSLVRTPSVSSMLISQKVFVKSFCESQFPHISVNTFDKLRIQRIS